MTKLLLIKYGAKVIGVGRDATKLLSLAEELPLKQRENFIYRTFDVGERAAWAALKAELDDLSVFPALVINNAGVFPDFALFTQSGAVQIERTLQVNFYSAVYSAEIFLPSLQGRGGLVNISSSAALCPIVGTASYCASKSALKGFTEAICLEYGKDTYIGIMFPGTTATSLFKGNKELSNSGLLERFATSPKKMASWIIKKILRKKKRAVLGVDAKAMNFLAKLAPVGGPKLIRSILKKFGAKYFGSVFVE